MVCWVCCSPEILRPEGNCAPLFLSLFPRGSEVGIECVSFSGGLTASPRPGFDLLHRSSVPFSVITVTTAGCGWRQVKLFGAAGVEGWLAGDERPAPWHRVTPSAQEELELFP